VGFGDCWGYLILHTQNIQSLMQLEIFYVFCILPRRVSAVLGRHQVLLLKLSHCNFYILVIFDVRIYSFVWCLALLRSLSTQVHFLVFIIRKILKIYASYIKFLKPLFLLKLSQLFLLGALHSFSYVVCLLYHLVPLCVFHCHYDVVFLTVLLFLVSGCYESYLNLWLR
jgi:hypothetical protein